MWIINLLVIRFFVIVLMGINIIKNGGKVLSKVLDRISNWLFPDDFVCICCGNEISKYSRYGVCDKCMKELPFIGNSACEICGARVIADSIICTDCKRTARVFERNYSVLSYTDQAVRLIHMLKYSNARYLAKYLGNMLYDKFLLINPNIDYIIPVPIHSNRRNQRGYNQTELMLNSFVNHIDKVATDILERTIDTPNQARLTKSERKENIKGSIRVVDKLRIKGKSILLVDDVLTSGATMDECAKVLFKAGASHVIAMTLANAHIESALEEEIDD